jgi:CBS domain-containing protein
MGQRIRGVTRQRDAGVVPVTENGFRTGMVTDRDIRIRVVAGDKNPEAAEVGDVTSCGRVVQEISN